MSDPVTVISAGIGNIGSVRSMLRRIGHEPIVTDDPEVVRRATKLILPGVGAFDAGMTGLREHGLDAAIQEAAGRGAWLLGICLGMHLLLAGSEEGRLPGVGLVAGRAKRFTALPAGLKVPHMGWNVVRAKRNSTLLDRGGDEQRFYFVHSYFVECDDAADAVGITTYGHDIVSVLERERVLGVQFHLEKSHRFGMAMLQRYLVV